MGKRQTDHRDFSKISKEDVDLGFDYDHLCNLLEEQVKDNTGLDNQDVFDLICQGGEPMDDSVRTLTHSHTTKRGLVDRTIYMMCTKCGWKGPKKWARLRDSAGKQR